MGKLYIFQCTLLGNRYWVDNSKGHCPLVVKTEFVLCNWRVKYTNYIDSDQDESKADFFKSRPHL